MVNQVAANDGEHLLHINAVFVFGQRRQACQVDIVLLFQHLHQGGVEGDILVASADDIVVSATAYDVDRHQQQRGITRPHALVVLKPFQQSQNEE